MNRRLLYIFIVSVFYVTSAQQEENLKILYYSPSTIGQDPYQNAMDLYTTFHSLEHKRDFDLMKQMGTDIVWISGGQHFVKDSASHAALVQLARQYKFRFLVTFYLPDELNSYSINNAREDFLLLIKEFKSNNYFDVLYGIYITAPADGINLRLYYGLINELSLMTDIPHAKIIAEVSIEPLTGDVLLYDYSTVNVHYWAMRFFSVEQINSTISSWLERDRLNRKIMPIVEVDSWSSSISETDQSQQAYIISDLIENLRSFKPSLNVGQYWPGFMGESIFEFSDEWWRSTIFTAGYDMEGCPNSNPYAHTPCGIVFGKNISILSVEFVGLFQISNRPFQFCVSPKESAQVVAHLWGGNFTFEAGDVICSPVGYFSGVTPYILMVTAIVATLFTCIFIISSGGGFVIKESLI